MTLADGPMLSLDSVTFDSAGTYTCEASTPTVPLLSRTQSFQLTVQGLDGWVVYRNVCACVVYVCVHVCTCLKPEVDSGCLSLFLAIFYWGGIGVLRQEFHCVALSGLELTL